MSSVMRWRSGVTDCSYAGVACATLLQTGRQMNNERYLALRTTMSDFWTHIARSSASPRAG
jgi:hypothetical protein